MTKVKAKLIFNLTSRQIICFGSAAAIGVPVYFMTKGVIGNSAAVLLMIGVMLPAFFVAMYEKDGMPAEKILLNILRMRWLFPSKRPYRTENFYKTIEKEALFESQSPKIGTAKKAPAAKRAASKTNPYKAKTSGKIAAQKARRV